MTSYRAQIVAHLIAALNTISVANGYASNLSVASGGGGAAAWLSKTPAVATSPFATVVSVGETTTADLYQGTQSILRVDLGLWSLYDQETASVDGWDVIDPLISDATRAILVAPNRGLSGVVIDTTIDGHEIRTADTEAGTFLFAVLRVSVPYRRRYGRDDVAM